MEGFGGNLPLPKTWQILLVSHRVGGPILCPPCQCRGIAVAPGVVRAVGCQVSPWDRERAGAHVLPAGLETAAGFPSAGLGAHGCSGRGVTATVTATPAILGGVSRGAQAVWGGWRPSPPGGSRLEAFGAGYGESG